jgi:hypothetical protein
MISPSDAPGRTAYWSTCGLKTGDPRDQYADHSDQQASRQGLDAGGQRPAPVPVIDHGDQGRREDLEQ